ncbi:MAG: hypothetical protein KBB11_11945 [Bacteroidales bacterium]|nr:hypothetical protein [Bacteroidales bacterium]HOY40053.1 hypothetical protein [Bacteroidales bacterium]HQP03367.1 hypothetical protein [Bacteroidales bacterium]
MRFLIIVFIGIGIFNCSLTPALGQGTSSGSLKAVLIVGYQEDGTLDAIEKMDKIAKLLKENGVSVYKFYDSNADWNEITKVSGECSFFIYSGHGSRLGEDGNVGGLCITTMVSTADILKDLHLKSNALVVFVSVCNGAGSSAGDDDDIGITEAKKRVISYAAPFFKIGAAAYYANNYDNGPYNFLKDFFSGESLKKAYLNSTTTWTDVEFDEPFPGHPDKTFSIASEQGGGIATRTTYINGVKKVEEITDPKGYEITYAGKPDFTIATMKLR